MKIVILDGYTCNPGDLDWKLFEAFGECVVYDRTSSREIEARASDAEVVLTNKTILNASTIAALPKLRYIGVLATGFNVVDGSAARARNIPVCNVPEYATENVAQAVFALLLEFANRVGHHAAEVAAGRWTKSPDWCFHDFPLMELKGLTMGLVGLGRIGLATARIGQAFGMEVVATRRDLSKNTEAGIPLMPLDELLSRSDVISLHCPLLEETRKMINSSRIALMKRSAILINTARGGLVNEVDLAEALNGGRIAGAGLDVLPAEPPPVSSPLLKAKNCIITPHNAWATKPARARLIKLAAENLRAFTEGKPQNVVN